MKKPQPTKLEPTLRDLANAVDAARERMEDTAYKHSRGSCGMMRVLDDAVALGNAIYAWRIAVKNHSRSKK